MGSFSVLFCLTCPPAVPTEAPVRPAGAVAMRRRRLVIAQLQAAGLALLAAGLSASGCSGTGATGTSPDLGSMDAATTDAEPPAVPSPWVAEHPQPTGNALHAVWSAGHLAYAVGELGTVVRLSDGTPGVTLEADGLTRANLNAVVAVGESVWAVGDEGTVLRRQGGAWSRSHLGKETLYTVFTDAAGTVYAAGQGDALWKYDGAVWSRSAMPGQTAADAAYAGAVYGDLLLLAGSSGRILRLDRQSTSWQRESDGLTPLSWRALLIQADGSGFAVGDGGNVGRRDGKTGRWRLDRSDSNPPPLSLRAVFTSQGAFYAVTETGLTLHRGSTGWESTGDAAVGRTAAGSGDDSGAFIVGAAGQIWHRGPQLSDIWQSALPVSTLTQSDITAIADAGDGSLYATSEDGLILRRAASGAWSVDGRAPLMQPLYALWAQGEEAYAVGAGGTVLKRRTVGTWQSVRYSYPDRQISWRGILALGPPRELVIVGSAVTNLGEQVAAVLHGTPATDTWGPETLATSIPEPLYAIAGNTSLAIAVGSSGTVLRRTGGLWVREGAEIGSDVQLVALARVGTGADADFYATGTRGALLFRDGKKPAPTWTRTPALVATDKSMFGGMNLLAGELWLAGSGGRIGYRSTTGIWLTEPTPTRADLRGLAAAGSTLFAVGQGGLILRRRAAPSHP